VPAQRHLDFLLTAKPGMSRNRNDGAFNGIRRKGIAVLKRGFASKEEAEDHPIRMSDWKRVWVEAFQASDVSATDQARAAPRIG
jgi:hypothetical protein